MSICGVKSIKNVICIICVSVFIMTDTTLSQLYDTKSAGFIHSLSHYVFVAFHRGVTKTLDLHPDVRELMIAGVKKDPSTDSMTLH